MTKAKLESAILIDYVFSFSLWVHICLYLVFFALSFFPFLETCCGNFQKSEKFLKKYRILGILNVTCFSQLTLAFTKCESIHTKSHWEIGNNNQDPDPCPIPMLNEKKFHFIFSIIKGHTFNIRNLQSTEKFK
jgi:hypothetical protein